MNKKLTASCLVAGALLLPITVYAADSTSATETTKTYVNDSIITTKVKAELADAKMSSLLHVSVNTDSQGVVTLSGTVPSQRASDRAATIARKVDGVTSVDNQIQIVAAK